MNNEKKNTLAERLELVKHKFKLNNGQLGEIAGVTGSAIFDILHGKTDNPRISLIKNIHEQLNVDLVWLVTGKGDILGNSRKANHQNETSMIEFLKNQLLEKDKVINYLITLEENNEQPG